MRSSDLTRRAALLGALTLPTLASAQRLPWRNAGFQAGLRFVSNVAAFSFSDAFTGDGPLRTRPGWQGWGENFADKNNVKSLSGVAGSYGGFSSRFVGAVDIGRTDVQSATFTHLGNVNGYLIARMSDEKNFFQLSVGTGSVSVSRTVNGTSTTYGSATARTAVAGDVWEIDVNGNTATLLLNGVRWPNASTSYDLSTIPLGSRVGFVNFPQGQVDAITAGYGPNALPRVTMDPINRLFQRAVGGASNPIAISGSCSGVTGLDMRLELTATGAAVSGWDWGQKALTNVVIGATSYTAKVPAGIPAGDGYRLRIRATNDNAAASCSRPFGVGDIFATYGQSNATGIYGSAAGTVALNPGEFVFQGGTIGGTGSTGAPVVADMMFGSGWANLAPAYILNVYNNGAGVPVGLIAAGQGGQTIANLRPSSAYIDTLNGRSQTYWAELVQLINAAGGDIAGFVYMQGESDAGSTASTTTLTFTASAANTYKAALNEMYSALLTLTGRSAANLPFGILGLAILANGTAGEAQGPNWAAVRLCQYQWCRDTTGAVLLGSAMDVAMNTVQTPPNWHYYGDVTGYGEAAKRIGYGLLRAKGIAATDRRGPLVTGITRSGSTIVMTLAANGTTGLTFAAANSVISPTNFVFGTDTSFATPLTPTGFTINSATQVTFTFGSAVAAGAAVRITQAQNPDTTNFLKGTYADGSVMTFPVWDALVAA